MSPCTSRPGPPYFIGASVRSRKTELESSVDNGTDRTSQRQKKEKQRRQMNREKREEESHRENPSKEGRDGLSHSRKGKKIMRETITHHEQQTHENYVQNPRNHRKIPDENPRNYRKTKDISSKNPSIDVIIIIILQIKIYKLKPHTPSKPIQNSKKQQQTNQVLSSVMTASPRRSSRLRAQNPENDNDPEQGALVAPAPDMIHPERQAQINQEQDDTEEETDAKSNIEERENQENNGQGTDQITIETHQTRERPPLSQADFQEQMVYLQEQMLGFTMEMTRIKAQNEKLKDEAQNRERQHAELTGLVTRTREDMKEETHQLRNEITVEKQDRCLPGFTVQQSAKVLMADNNTNIFAALDGHIETTETYEENGDPQVYIRPVMAKKIPEKEKLKIGIDLVKWFGHLDFWFDGYEVPRRLRLMKVINEGLSPELRDLYLNEVQAGRQVREYAELKKFLYIEFEGKHQIEKKLYAMMEWKQSAKQKTLVQAYRDFRGCITAYIKEVKFAITQGISRDRIVVPDEKSTFLVFVNNIHASYRRRMLEFVALAGGQYKVEKLETFCLVMDNQNRPGLGIKPVQGTEAKKDLYLMAMKEVTHEMVHEVKDLLSMDRRTRRGNNGNDYRRGNRDRKERTSRPKKWCANCRRDTHWTSECYKGGNREKHREQAQNQHRSARCYHCNKLGHIKAQCFKLYPEKLEEWRRRRKNFRVGRRATTRDVFLMDRWFGDPTKEEDSGECRPELTTQDWYAIHQIMALENNEEPESESHDRQPHPEEINTMQRMKNEIRSGMSIADWESSSDEEEESQAEQSRYQYRP